MQADQKTSFPTCFYGSYRVELLTPGQIDELLANGWFRNDLNAYSTTARPVKKEWRPCVMLRIPVENYIWKKRLRKLMRRNGSFFSVEIKPFRPSAEKEALWQVFKNKIHRWGYVPALDKHLLKDRSPYDFHSWELNVFHEGKLAAFSVFDKGLVSMASHEAAYDPAFKKYSLGLYTMLLEIDYCSRQGLSYYYPGFFPRDTPMFDYKLRPGGVEFFRVTEGRWVPWEEWKPDDWLFEQVLSNLNELREILSRGGIAVEIAHGYFPNRPAAQPKLTDFNVFLLLQNPGSSRKENCFAITWHPLQKKYLIFQADLFSFPSPESPGFEKSWVMVRNIFSNKLLGEYDRPGEVLPELNRLL